MMLDRLDSEALRAGNLNSSFMGNTTVTDPAGAAPRENGPLAPRLMLNENSSDTQWSLTLLMNNQITTRASIPEPLTPGVTFNFPINSVTNIDTSLSSMHLIQPPAPSDSGVSVPHDRANITNAGRGVVSSVPIHQMIIVHQLSTEDSTKP